MGVTQNIYIKFQRFVDTHAWETNSDKFGDCKKFKMLKESKCLTYPLKFKYSNI